MRAATLSAPVAGGERMGINRESDVAANLQIGPTSLGMVRLYVEAGEFELPLAGRGGRQPLTGTRGWRGRPIRTQFPACRRTT